ncbi:MAG: hypothetical protein K1X53_14395 [Candidatus Sumerlaeaceae bacterium]|nr:hypothetical protein [Candidatus Sumerlaeaceae bacterium]
MIAILAVVATPLAAQTTIRIVASNTTSGNNQDYQAPGQHILQALKPDIALMQEFNVPGTNDDAGVSAFVTSVFGAGYSWYREPKGSANIPNGIVSKYPILAAGEWDDTQVSDRDFVWARIDIPGSIDLYVISVHLLTASSGVRNTEAQQIINTYLPTLNIPSNAYLAIGGDFNTDSRSESCISTFSSKFVTASPYPVGQDGSGNTNAGRNKPYDWVLVNSNLDSLEVATVSGTFSYANGLVFDTRDFNQTQLNASFPPALTTDSGATNMQHMAVARTFVVPGGGTVTNGNTVSVSTINRAPATAAAGATVPMLSIVLTANANEWDAGTVTINRLGTLPDAFVTPRIYLDSNQNGVVDGAEALLGTGSFSSGSSVITLSPAPRSTAPTAMHLLAVASVAGAAAEASTVQFQLAANGVTYSSTGGTDVNPTFSAVSSGVSTISGSPPPPPGPAAGCVVINKYLNSGTTGDTVELLVVQDQLDMRGMIMKDFSSSMASDGGGKYTFSTNALWSSVRAGTLIILRNDATAADVITGGTDFVLDVGLANTTYFTSGGGTFDIGGTEMVMIKAAGSGTSGSTGSWHALASGTAGIQYTAAPTPKLRAATASNTGQYCYAVNNNGSAGTESVLTNFTDATGLALGGGSGQTFGTGNTTDNTNFILFLRGTAATGGTGATGTAFVANWNSLVTATSYRLDVSTNSNFSSFVTGYNDLGVGNVTSYPVTGLTPGTYYYRVRGVNREGTRSRSSDPSSANISSIGDWRIY